MREMECLCVGLQHSSRSHLDQATQLHSLRISTAPCAIAPKLLLSLRSPGPLADSTAHRRMHKGRRRDVVMAIDSRKCAGSRRPNIERVRERTVTASSRCYCGDEDAHCSRMTRGGTHALDPAAARMCDRHSLTVQALRPLLFPASSAADMAG